MEQINQPKSLRQEIVGEKSVQELLEGGSTHEVILSELEDMVEDEYGYNKIITVAENALSQTDLDDATKGKYQKLLNYCTQVRALNGEDYDI
jgi:hypothetical protein